MPRRFTILAVSVSVVTTLGSALLGQSASAASASTTVVPMTVEMNKAASVTAVGMNCPADHPYLVLDEKGDNMSSYFRNVTYHLDDGERLRFGEYAVPFRSADEHPGYYTGVNLRVQLQDNKVASGHRGMTMQCTDSATAAHQAW